MLFDKHTLVHFQVDTRPREPKPSPITIDQSHWTNRWQTKKWVCNPNGLIRLRITSHASKSVTLHEVEIV